MRKPLCLLCAFVLAIGFGRLSLADDEASGKKVDRAVDNASNKVDRATDKIGDTARDATNKTKDKIGDIDVKTEKVVGSVDLKGKPEFAVADEKGHIYVNLEDKSEVLDIDADKLKVVHRWPLAPGEPYIHGYEYATPAR